MYCIPVYTFLAEISKETKGCRNGIIIINDELNTENSRKAQKKVIK